MSQCQFQYIFYLAFTCYQNIQPLENKIANHHKRKNIKNMHVTYLVQSKILYYY